MSNHKNLLLVISQTTYSKVVYGKALVTFKVNYVQSQELVDCDKPNTLLQGKQCPFYFMCIFRDLPEQKNPSVLCRRSSPNFICCHVPMELFLFYGQRKK